MSGVCRLIPNFAGGMSADALWRLCASSRLANHRSVFHSCQLFQEKVNLFSKSVNDSRKVSTCSGKRLSTTSGKEWKTVNRNQEKTLFNDIKRERKVMDDIHTCLRTHNHPLQEWYYGHFHESWHQEIEGVKYHMLDCGELREMVMTGWYHR